MPEMKWYVVHTYSGFEQKCKQALEENYKKQGLSDFFGEILVPSEPVVEAAANQTKRTVNKKFFPGYILVQMMLTDKTWHCVKETNKITGFVGNATKPPPVPPHEIEFLKGQMTQGAAKPKPVISFEEGDNVHVKEGPFAGFNGIVEEVKPDKGRVVVSVSIFGRATPIELDFSQIEKE